MKKNFTISLMLTITAYTYSQGFGEQTNINEGWKFRLEDVKDAEKESTSLRWWKTVDLPHDWSVEGELSPTLASCTGYLPGGIGWYRKSLEVPAENQGKKIYLYFEGVYNRSEVYLNGHLLGKRPNGYISFMYDATEHVKFGEKNTLAVRVDHSQSADSRWYTGSGIYRDVWMVTANPVHIAQWGVYAYSSRVTAKKGCLNIEVELENSTTEKRSLLVRNTLYDCQGNVVGKSSNKHSAQPYANRKITTQITISNPHVWSTDAPYLYTLVCEVFEGKTCIDTYTTKTGFRTLAFDPNTGFSLNGEQMKVKGVCLHHDAGVLGSVVPKAVWRRRLMTLKEVGCNAIRTSHNPQATDLYELCDELGLLVMNEMYDEWEFPKRKWITGWNHGTPGLQGTFDIFADWSERDLADFVRRDRNHVSVFAWSIGNEVDYPNDPYSHPALAGLREGGFTQPIFGGYKKDAPDANRLSGISKRLAETVKQFDTSRPVTAGLAGVVMSNETDYPSNLNIAGYNYTESRYDTDHAKYPNRVIFGSENRHDFKAWCEVVEHEHIFGQFLWTGIDYLGESGQWPSRGFYSGLLDFGGFIKPRGYFRQSLWSSIPMAYIGTYPIAGGNDNDVWSQLEKKNGKKNAKPSMDAWPVWNYQEGEMVRVVCYTNGASARLLLNGVEIGARKEYDNTTGIIYWDVPYQDGELLVESFNVYGVLCAQQQIITSGRPYALKLEKKWVDEATGLVQVLIEVVDKQGQKVMLADNEITCQIVGEALLLGLEASNNSDMSSYNDNVHRAYMGQLLAYVQLKDKKQVKLKFSSPLLQQIIVEL